MKVKFDLKRVIENPNFLRISIVSGVLAIILIFVSSFVDFSAFQRNKISDEYCTELEDKLLSVVTQIEGVGDARIFLTMDNDGESVYLNNSDTKTKSIAPVVRGVVIVCDGGDDPVVVSRVVSAVTKSLDISTNRVCVTKLSK